MNIVPRTILLLLCICAVSLASSNEKDLKPFEGKIITRIDIVRKNVFDDQLSDDPPFYYPWANSLHVLTRARVIRRELLFKEGDRFDLQKLIETERNLRAGGFIGEVEVKASADTSDGVALTVTTTDLWTTKTSVFLDVAGGKYAAGMGIVEQNLAGLGKTIQLSGQVSNDQDGGELIYYDPRLLASHLALNLAYSYFDYNKGYMVALARPKYALSIPYSWRVALSEMHTRVRLFYKGNEYFRYKNKRIIFDSEGVYYWGGVKRINFRGGYSYDGNKFSPEIADSPLNHIIPSDEIFSYPLVGIGASTIHYDLERFLDGAGTPEDLTLGASVRLKAGISDKALGANFEGTYQETIGQFFVKPRSGVFIGGFDKVAWWRRGGTSTRIRHISEFALYYRPADMHLFAIHALTDFAWRQRTTYQVLLGGGNGLRGHSFYELSGSKLALGNIEYRLYFPVEVLTIKLGAAAFFDIGNVWRSGENIHLSQLKSDTGIGLRFGLTKSSTSRVINLDMARSLSDGKLFISFGVTAPFNLAFANIND